ncbi:MAG: hypothetical protein QNK37_30705 [Acidobacteriota bacterium]|nr:hypothetical protein [Acidobacteriota bacterium]
MVNFILCWVLVSSPLEHWTVSAGISEIEGHGDEVTSPPNQIMVHNGIMAVLDRDQKIWLFSIGDTISVRTVFGGKGKAPGQFLQAEHLYAQDGIICVVQDFGTRARIEKFNLEGDYLGVDHVQSAQFIDDRQRIFMTPKERHSFSPLSITWTYKEKETRLELGDPEDKTFVSRYQLVKLGSFFLIYSRHSVNRRIYYALLNGQRGEVWEQGYLVQAEKRRLAEFNRLRDSLQGLKTLPTLDGCTASEEIGFVFTEYTAADDYRMLQVLEPNTRKKRVLKMTYGDHYGNLTHFQHLRGSLWAAYSSADQWVFFHVKKVD